MENDNRDTNKKEEGFMKKYMEKICSVIVGILGSGAVFVGSGMVSKTDVFLERIDVLLTMQLFLAVVGVAFAIMALLVPQLFVQEKEISAQDAPRPERLDAFDELVRAHKHLFLCFMFCMLGVANSFVWDGPLEFNLSDNMKQGLQEVGKINNITADVRLYADLAEDISSTFLLFAGLTFLFLGGKTFIKTVDKLVKSVELKLRSLKSS